MGEDHGVDNAKIKSRKEGARVRLRGIWPFEERPRAKYYASVAL